MQIHALIREIDDITERIGEKVIYFIIFKGFFKKNLDKFSRVDEISENEIVIKHQEGILTVRGTKKREIQKNIPEHYDTQRVLAPCLFLILSFFFKIP